MRKIPTVFIRDMSKQPALVAPEVTPGCEWVLAGEGVPTEKIDGTCCLIRDGRLYKRHELRPGKIAPPDFEAAQEPDPITGKQPGWVPVGDGPEDQYHREAFEKNSVWLPGTYELVGPKVQGNPYKLESHSLIRHESRMLIIKDEPRPRTFDSIKHVLSSHPYPPCEGIVWHHIDGHMAKIKRRDFGLPWPYERWVKKPERQGGADGLPG